MGRCVYSSYVQNYTILSAIIWRLGLFLGSIQECLWPVVLSEHASDDDWASFSTQAAIHAACEHNGLHEEGPRLCLWTLSSCRLTASQTGLIPQPPPERQPATYKRVHVWVTVSPHNKSFPVVQDSTLLLLCVNSFILVLFRFTLGYLLTK